MPTSYRQRGSARNDGLDYDALRAGGPRRRRLRNSQRAQ